MSEQKKYEFTGEIKTIFGIEFKQIRAIVNFGCVVPVKLVVGLNAKKI